MGPDSSRAKGVFAVTVYACQWASAVGVVPVVGGSSFCDVHERTRPAGRQVVDCRGHGHHAYMVAGGSLQMARPRTRSALASLQELDDRRRNGGFGVHVKPICDGESSYAHGSTSTLGNVRPAAPFGALQSPPPRVRIACQSQSRRLGSTLDILQILAGK